MNLGILGLGNKSTLFYLNALNELYNTKKGGYTTCPYLLLNSNFDLINPYLPHKFKKLVPTTKGYIQQLLNLGVDKILIPNITLHETIDQLNFDKNLFIHPLVILKTELLKQINSQKSVILLGTKFTMQNNYFLDGIQEANLEVKQLKTTEFTFIEQFRNKVYNKTVTKKMIKNYNQLITDLCQDNIVVIACTELALNLTSQSVINIPMLQIAEAVNFVMDQD